MRLSSQVRYAICAVFDLAYNAQGEALQVRVIGERQQIPVRYLEQIFQRLRRAGLVSGRRGPGGGFRLARPAREITLRDVVEAVEGPLDGGGPGAPGRRGAGPAPYRPDFLWPQLADRIGAALAETTLEALCRDAARAAVRRANEDARMWHI